MNLEPIIQSEMSEIERQILYTNICMWNLEKWNRLTYLHRINEDADMGNRLMDAGWKGKERVGRIERVALKRIHYHM